MKNILLGFILGFALSLPITAIAYNSNFTDWEQTVVDLLEDIERHGEDITSDVETILDRM